ncbi:MAG: SdrD B-like domain-containing protein, partial [Chitinophagaceae bacterium]
LVTLYNSSNVAIANTVTDANGFYLFSNLLPGTYSVGFSNIPSSSSFTIQNAGVATAATNSDPDPATGRTATFSLVAGQAKRDIDAGLVTLLAAVGDYVWNDLNHNGIQDAGEPPVAGVTVTLYNSANVAVASAVTDANGFYLINNIPLPVGGANFTIGFTDIPSGMVFTTKNAVGSTTDNDSNADPVTGLTDPFALNPGQIRLDIDAGVYRPINLSGNVWHDANALLDNLVNQTSPLAIPVGLRMYLVNTTTGLIERVTLVSGATGTFNFNNINPNITYRLFLSSVSYPVGSSQSVFPIVPIIPGGWEHTGQKNANPPNSPLGSDGINDGKITVPVGINSVININFGIRITGGDVVQG